MMNKQAQAVAQVEDSKVRKAMEAIHNPEVQIMLKKLSEYGLAIAVPHMHDDNGKFVSLPDSLVSLEKNRKVSFIPREQAHEHSLEVMWGWDEQHQAPLATCCCQEEC